MFLLVWQGCFQGYPGHLCGSRMQTPLNEFLWLKTVMVNSNAYRGWVDTKKQGWGGGVRQEAVTAAKGQPVSSS